MAYHHGDLKQSAIDLAIELAAKKGHEKVGLREIAKSLDVSATALYHHFPNKTAFMQAIALKITTGIAKEQLAAHEKKGAGRKGMTEMGLVYIRFAVDNPNLYRLMLAFPVTFDFVEASKHEASITQSLFLELERLLPKATDRGRLLNAIRIAALTQGIANMVLNGNIVFDEKLIRDILNGLVIS